MDDFFEEEEEEMLGEEEEEEEGEEELLDDDGIDDIKMKYKNMKSFKRNKKDKKKHPPHDDYLYNRNILVSHALYKQGVVSFLEKCPSFKGLDSLKSEILVVNTTNILHHCNMLWNGALDSFYGDVDIQLPKDCNLRIYASIYFVVTQVYPLMQSLRLGDILKDFYDLDKSIEKSRKRGEIKKTKEKLFFDNLHRFLVIIHQYDLGGRKYKRICDKFITDVTKIPRCDLLCVNESPATRMYGNLLKHFFELYKEYGVYKIRCTDLVEDALYNVLLEGKGVRLVHMVCIYYVIVISNLPSPERKRGRKSTGGREGVPLSSMRINTLIEDKGNVSGVLYDRLMDHYLTMLEEDTKIVERRRKNFIKCLQKYIRRT